MNKRKSVTSMARLHTLSMLLSGTSFLNNGGRTHVFYFMGNQWCNNSRRRRKYHMKDAYWVMEPMGFFQKLRASLSKDYHKLEERGNKLFPKTKTGARKNDDN